MTPRFHQTKVAAVPKTLYTYYVSGKGAFPFDMLRYDTAWPATGEDAPLLGCSNQEFRSVLMFSFKEPTIDRWSSFGWSVGVEKL